MEKINSLLQQVHETIEQSKKFEDGVLPTLFSESFENNKSFLPVSVLIVMDSYFQFKKDIFNGGLDQVAWNINREYCEFASIHLKKIGASQNGDLLYFLVQSKKEFDKEYSSETIKSDPVKYFLMYRKLVKGPYFEVPEYFEEVLEKLEIYIKSHPHEIPKNTDEALDFDLDIEFDQFMEEQKNK